MQIWGVYKILLCVDAVGRIIQSDATGRNDFLCPSVVYYQSLTELAPVTGQHTLEIHF